MGVSVMFPHAGPKMSLAYLTRCTLNSPTAPQLFNPYFHISPQLVYDVSLLFSTTPCQSRNSFLITGLILMTNVKC